jgi:hypothetical protein
MVDASSLSGMQGRLFLECCMVDERACGEESLVASEERRVFQE